MSKPKVQSRAAIRKGKGHAKPAEVKILRSHRYPLTLIISLVLIVGTLAVFSQVRNHEFINFDDNEYVTNNPQVKAGLTFRGVIWAFTTSHASNWHPLTWLSHMLDCTLYGLKAGGHHMTNLLFHIANSLLLFLVLRWMTGALWESSFVAALFALHPLHVGSVAWIAERKDVLSAFFWMLTMGAYVRYAQRPGFNKYLVVVLCFVLGLLSKPMLVTLPFVMLLLDYWPLSRFQFGQSSGDRDASTHNPSDRRDQRSSVLRLVLEKAPFFALSAVSSFLTFFVQQRGGTVGPLEAIPLESRIENALTSYVQYIGKMVWPHRLAIFYPYPERLPLWQVGGAFLLLIGISVLVIRFARSHPYLVVGWLWYLGTLVPVIGLVQVGMQAMADRYTYVPLVGLFMMIAWGVPDLLKGWRHRRALLALSAGILFSALAIVTWVEVQRWQNSITLFQHTLEVTSKNSLIHYNLGVVLLRQGKNPESIAHFDESLRIDPNRADAHNNLGVALARQGRMEEAVVHYVEALRIKPDYADAHNNLGTALARQGKIQEAMIHFAEVLRIKPDQAEAYGNIGNCLVEQGRMEEAIAHYKEALRIKPSLSETHFSLGLAYLAIGNRNSALEEYNILKTVNPNLANTLSQKIFK